MTQTLFSKNVPEEQEAQKLADPEQVLQLEIQFSQILFPELAQNPFGQFEMHMLL